VIHSQWDRDKIVRAAPGQQLTTDCVFDAELADSSAGREDAIASGGKGSK
jgi:hypothetical protein